VVAVAAQAVPGAKFKIISFPDAPAPAPAQMMYCMTPTKDNIVAAACRLLS